MVELTRRDALAALAVGAGSTAGCVSTPDSNDDERLERTVESLVAAAEVVYPTDVEDPREFVETYVAGRIEGRPAYREGVEAAVAELDSLSETWYDASFSGLSPPQRDEVLRQSGADTAEADPGGGQAGQIRYYVVNELLYALFSSPAGGRLVGTENPVGHPGGIASYQRGPGQ
jgi:hypothetical protein